MSAGLGEAGLVTVVQVFDGDGGEVVDGFVGPFGVEPTDRVQDGGFEVVAVAPGPVGPDEFGLEQADLRLGQCVVVGVADRPDRGVDTGLEVSVGEGNGSILPGLPASV